MPNEVQIYLQTKREIRTFKDGGYREKGLLVDIC